jgi:hyperosmotically inducible protein
MNKLVQLIPQQPQQRRWALMVSTVALASLAACNQPGDDTVGQKVDRGIATTERATERAAENTGKAMENAGQKIEAGAERAAEATSDAATTAAVKAALIAAPDLSAMAIDVDTKDSVVTLNGTVKTEAQKSQAVDAAAKVNGVKNVVSNLTIGS